MEEPPPTTSTPRSTGTTPRVRPGLIPALIVFVIYLVLVVGLTAVFTDVEYTEVTSSAANFRDGVVIPIGLASLFLAAVTSYFGWWKPALFEERSTPRWLTVWPVLAIIAFVASIAVDANQWDPSLFVLLLVGFSLVGFSEELMTRGLLLTGARAQYREVWAWLICTSCFALMHGLNIISGQDAATTAVQVASTFGSGTLFYFGRRIGGTLFVGIALHMLFDTALAVHGGPGAELNSDTSSPPAAAAVFQLVGVVFLIIALRKKMLNRTNPGPYIEPLLSDPAPR